MQHGRYAQLGVQAHASGGVQQGKIVSPSSSRHTCQGCHCSLHSARALHNLLQQAAWFGSSSGLQGHRVL